MVAVNDGGLFSQEYLVYILGSSVKAVGGILVVTKNLYRADRFGVSTQTVQGYLVLDNIVLYSIVFFVLQ